MSYWQHHREYDHRDTEDCSTVALSAGVGRYAEGSELCAVLEDLWQRLSLVSTDVAHGFYKAGLDAFIAPYDTGGLGGGLLGVIGLDAYLGTSPAATFGLDAAIDVVGEVSSAFGLSAVVHVSDVAVGQLEDPIDVDDTVIVITNPGDFPTTCPYLLQIGDEIVTVVSGCGTDTLTIVRGDNATSHPAGDIAFVC